MWPPTIVPTNAALYNLRSDNLATHGLHPRWLHFAINAPMIVGIGPWWHCVSSVACQRMSSEATIPSDATHASMEGGELQRISLSIIALTLACVVTSPVEHDLYLAEHTLNPTTSGASLSSTTCFALLHPLCNVSIVQQRPARECFICQRKR
jgi:hypothetical protein